VRQNETNEVSLERVLELGTVKPESTPVLGEAFGADVEGDCGEER